MPDWLIHAISGAGVTSAAILIIEKYLLARINHGFDARLEKIKPLTAEETLRRQNFLNAKRDVCFQTVELATRMMAADTWTGPDVPTDRQVVETFPTEAEINACLGKLAIFTDDSQVLESFLEFFGQPPTAVNLGTLVGLLRSDLGYGSSPTEAENYKYVFRRSPKGT